MAQRMMSSTARNILSLEKALGIKKISDNVFINTETLYVPTGARGVFGGSIAAQSLYAAIKTVPDSFVPHSLHSYFILNGDADKKIHYHVDALRDGNSFSSREVKAYQDGTLIFTQNISFMNTNPKRPLTNQLSHRKQYPGHVNIDDYKSALDVIKNTSHYKGGTTKEGLYHQEETWKRFENGSVEHRFPDDFFEHPDESHPNADKNPEDIDLNMFVRVQKPIIDPKFHYVALTYYSDAMFLITSLKFHNRHLHSHVMSVSLDHVIYFHKPFTANDWQLFHIKHPNSGTARNFLYGEFYDNDELFATVVQEGYVVIDPETNKARRVKTSKL